MVSLTERIQLPTRLAGQEKWVRILLFLVFCGAGGALVGDHAQAAQEPTAATGSALGRPGFLILSAARDSSSGYHWQPGPGAGQKSLVWAAGQLVLPDSLALEPFGADDLGVATGPELRGSGSGGVLTFRDGRFSIDQPLLLTDGIITLYTADGDLEIRGAQVRYLPPGGGSAPPPGPTDPRAGFLFLAGMVVLIVVLMRSARLRSRKLKP